jgi:hypothetical protein
MTRAIFPVPCDVTSFFVDLISFNITTIVSHSPFSRFIAAIQLLHGCKVMSFLCLSGLTSILSLYCCCRSRLVPILRRWPLFLTRLSFSSLLLRTKLSAKFHQFLQSTPPSFSTNCRLRRFSSNWCRLLHRRNLRRKATLPSSLHCSFSKCHQQSSLDSITMDNISVQPALVIVAGNHQKGCSHQK